MELQRGVVQMCEEGSERMWLELLGSAWWNTGRSDL